MNKLYIIGNGFDLHHGLPTKYSDFRCFVCKNNPELFAKVMCYYSCALWSDFERELGRFKISSFIKDFFYVNKVWNRSFQQDCLFENEIDYYYEIQLCFTKWVNSISLNGFYPDLEIEKDSFFFSFNYTDTLNKLYGVSNDNIKFIHGSKVEHDRQIVDTQIIYNGAYTFGHILEKTEIEEYVKSEILHLGKLDQDFIYKAKNEFSNFMEAFRKDVQDIINLNEQYFNRLVEVDSVYVLGHSMTEIDKKYFEKIRNSIKNNAFWRIEYYGGSEEEKRKIQFMNELKVSKSCFELVTYEDIKKQDE